MITHLEELRYRLGISLLGILLIFVVLIFFSDQTFTLLAKPLVELNQTHLALIATQITTPIWVPLQLSFILSVLLGLPWLGFQCWRFIKPGLLPSEIKSIRNFALAGLGLFYLGLFAAYWGLLPITLKIIHQWLPPNVNYLPDIEDYLSFCSKLCLAGGIAAQVPVLTIALVKLNFINHTQLKAARPYVLLISLILGMLLTPPDVISQILLAVPMYVLFELGCWLSR